MNQSNIIERAYELARSGRLANIDQVLIALKREKFELVDAHIAGGSSLKRELQRVCRAAWAEAGNAPTNSRGAPAPSR